MAEPTSTAAVAIATAGGLTVFGVVTGLHPALLVAGMAGGWWALSYRDPMPLRARVASVVISAISAAWCAPVVGGVLSSLSWWPAQTVAPEILQLPIACVLGRLAHTFFGPALDKLVARKMEGV